MYNTDTLFYARSWPVSERFVKNPFAPTLNETKSPTADILLRTISPSLGFFGCGICQRRLTYEFAEANGRRWRRVA